MPSPPPISLVAGRGDISTHQLRNPDETNKIVTSFGIHQLKSNNGNGPLGPINLNAPASWSKMSPYVPVNYSSASRSAFGMFSPPSSSPRSPSHQLGHYSSHFTPLSGYREPGSPPHVSPPLSHEPAYPVLRIEENHRPRIVSPSSYPEVKRETFSNHHQQIVVKQESYHPHSCPSEPTYFTSYQVSPSHSPCQESGSHEKQNSPNPAPIVPINVNGSVRYQCPDCSKSYSTYSGLSKHMQFHCASQNKKSFVCKFCEKVYVSLGALKMHIRTHTLPCKCHLCGKAFSRPWLLQGKFLHYNFIDLERVLGKVRSFT